MFKKIVSKRIFQVLLFVVVLAIPTTIALASHANVWNSLLMPYTVVGSGQIRTANNYWIDNGNRCPTGRGVEYVFQYTFSSNVTNPAALRTNSLHPLVEAGIINYTRSYGGLKTWYDTTSPTITTCVGDATLSIVGAGSVANGAAIWKNWAKVYKP